MEIDGMHAKECGVMGMAMMTSTIQNPMAGMDWFSKVKLEKRSEAGYKNGRLFY